MLAKNDAVSKITCISEEKLAYQRKKQWLVA